jgi:transcriptional regulator with XRE-family HTH domain
MKPSPINTIRDLGAVARGRRRALGLSQGDLARRAGVSRQWISGFETGNPGAELRLVIALLDALDLRLLVDGSSATPGPPGARGAGVDLDALLDNHRGR